MIAVPLSQQLARIQLGRHAAILPCSCSIPKHSRQEHEPASGADDVVRLRLMLKKLRFLVRAYTPTAKCSSTSPKTPHPARNQRQINTFQTSIEKTPLPEIPFTRIQNLYFI